MTPCLGDALCTLDAAIVNDARASYLPRANTVVPAA